MNCNLVFVFFFSKISFKSTTDALFRKQKSASQSLTMSLLQQVKDAIKGLVYEEMQDLYNYLGELLSEEEHALTCNSSEDTVKEFVVTEEAPVKPEDVSDEESDAAQIPPPSNGPLFQLQPQFQPPPSPQPLPQLQSQPEKVKWVLDYSSQMPRDAESCCDGPSVAPPSKYYTRDTAKNIVQQYHQTFIDSTTTPKYEQAWEDPEFMRLRYTAGFASMLKLQLDSSHELKFCGTGSRKVEAEKDAALKACEYLEQTGRLEEMLGKGPSSKRPVQSSDGLTPENAAGYLMHCKNTFEVMNVERPDPMLCPGGFVAETIVVTNNGRKTFRNERPHSKKKEARNDADYQAALWVRRETGVNVPGAMAR